MSIFEQSTPDFAAPVEDTVEETADIQEEVSEETEETETTDTNEDSTDSESEHSEELLAGKYKTTEDLIKGYKNLEQQFHQSRQQTQQQPQQTQQPVQQAQTDYTDVFWANFQENPLATMQYLIDNVVSQKTAPIYEQREQEMLGKNIEAISKEYKQISTEDGMSAIFQKVGEIAQDLGNPKLANNPSPRVLKMAAMELWGDSNGQMYNKAKEQGRIEAENARKAKQGINSIAVTKKPNETPRTAGDEIRESIRAASQKSGLFG